MFEPFKTREFTVRAVVLGTILAIILGAANTYLGLYAGMTVSASIPAAVLSMAILRGILRKGTILENNMVQAIASSGESVAAGVIFTVPALVLTQAWHHFRYWPTTLLAISGSLLGILFMIPLRRALIIEEKELCFPEGTACAEVLKAGDEGGKGGRLIFLGILAGGVYKFLIEGLSLMKGLLEVAFQAGRSLFYIGTANSLALTAVGYIVGLNIGTLVVTGGVISWIIGIPLYTFMTGIPAGETLGAAWSVWSTQIRYMGVGAMAVGGLWTIWSVRHGLKKGFRKIFGSQPLISLPDRTDQDLSRKIMLPLLGVSMLMVIFLYKIMTGSLVVSIASTLIMTFACFFFVAVSSYIVGLVGSSNTPVSGMTICTLLFASAILLLFGFKGVVGLTAVLGVAGVVCCAATSANDISQDLKTGCLVGATPKKMQIGEIIGAVAASLV
ncbi:MAG: oligopeptide transporter, OPT family, partial [bacterium]|nr:oligopeptide transporter, OPT family [bacterium]